MMLLCWQAMVHLRPLPQQGLDPACLPAAAIGSDGLLRPESLDFLGPQLPDSLCRQIAEGEHAVVSPARASRQAHRHHWRWTPGRVSALTGQSV